MRTLVLIAALAGCDPVHQANVAVVVPVAVQQAYSADDPGEVVLRVDTQGNFAGTFVLGVLCEATDADRTAPWVLGGVGCAMEATLTAWVRDADPASTCDAPAATVIAGVEPTPDDPQATGVLFAGNTTGCPSGEDAVTLTLE